MGLSRNKVSLRERGDGSPPFYGESESGKFPDIVHLQPKLVNDWYRRLICGALLSFERSAMIVSTNLLRIPEMELKPVL